MGRLDGKVAVITGGASGIGEATAHTLAREGASVVIGDVQTDRAEAVARAVSAEHGGDCLALTTDVTSAEDVRGLVRAPRSTDSASWT